MSDDTGTPSGAPRGRRGSASVSALGPTLRFCGGCGVYNPPERTECYRCGGALGPEDDSSPAETAVRDVSGAARRAASAAKDALGRLRGGGRR